MLKIRSTCNKNYVEKFGVERPADWDYKYINFPCSDEELAEQCKDADVIHCGPSTSSEKKSSTNWKTSN